MPQLAAYVHATAPNGEIVVLAPGVDVPDWAVAAVRNPKAWQGGEAPDLPAESVSDIPPKGGPGSGIDAWKAYADAKNVEYSPDDKREDIIAALEAAGVPTE